MLFVHLSFFSIRFYFTFKKGCTVTSNLCPKYRIYKSTGSFLKFSLWQPKQQYCDSYENQKVTDETNSSMV